MTAEEIRALYSYDRGEQDYIVLLREIAAQLAEQTALMAKTKKC